ncbi:MAG: class I SAM-dependent DNA methyltransferase [Burkholderiales bacterium]
MEAYGYLSEVYNELMADVDYEMWAGYLDGILKRHGVKTVFETGCGTGNITRELYRLGYDITASDISEAMINVAAVQARKLGYDIKFILQDMRNIEVGNKPDAILSVCDGPNYLDEAGLKSFAACAFNALKSNGVLVFDISSKSKLKRMDGEVYFDDGDDTTCIWQNIYDGKSNSLCIDVTLFVRRGRLFERFSERHIQYAYDPGFVEKVFLSAGFASVSIFDCFTEDKPNDNSERIQFVCRKASA